MTQHALYVQGALLYRDPVVKGLNALPSDHAKNRLDIEGFGLFMGGELTGYWGLIVWEKWYQGNGGPFLP